MGKPSIATPRCKRQVKNAAAYIRRTSPKEAENFLMAFLKVTASIEAMPGLGTRDMDGMRKKLLGKFRYWVFYEEQETKIDILGIWHTSRGTLFDPSAEDD
jgi:plasmid stabilization system protein ParE